MKTNITRVLVWVFAAAVLGSFSLAPRPSYGLNAGDSSNNEYKDRVESQRAYNEAYNQAFDEAYQDRVDENSSVEEGQSCGG